MVYNLRLKNAQELIKKFPNAAFIVDDQVNIYYMTGLNISAGTLLIHHEGAHLFVDARYYELCKKSSPFSVLLTSTLPLEDALNTPRFTFIKNLAFNNETTSYQRYQELETMINTINGKNNRNIKLTPTKNLIKQLRMVKDEIEITKLKEAASLGSEGFDFICSFLKEGVTEAEIAVELEIFWKRRGSKALAFDPIIAFGANTSMPHYKTDHAKLKKGQPILIDIGVNYNHYHSDMTRVLFFGDPDPKMETIYSIVHRAQKAALDMCKPGTSIGELDDSARQLINDEGYGDYFTHSLGHGIGLEIHESPILRNKPPYDSMILEPGMVITIEPGIYLPGLGGVRIEDTILITEQGCENLTNRPTDLVIL